MRSLGSLVRAGWEPETAQQFYIKNCYIPKLEYYHRDGFGYDRRLVFSKPNPDLAKFYIHPYFPGEPVVKVEIVQPLPHAKKGLVVEMDGHFLVLQDETHYSVDTIYRYPTFFKPHYE